MMDRLRLSRADFPALMRVGAVTTPLIGTTGLWLLVNTDRVIISEVLFLLVGIVIGIFVAGCVGTTRAERQRLKFLFLIAFAARILLFITLYCSFLILYPESKGFFFYDGDAMLYAELGEAVADEWRAAGFSAVESIPIYSMGQTLFLTGDVPVVSVIVYGMIYLNAVVFYLFGNDIFLLIILSALWGALLPVFLYSIASSFCAEPTARLAGWLAALYPGLLLQSVVPYKDVLAAFLGTLVMWACLRLKDGVSLRRVFLLLTGLLAFLSIHLKVFPALLAGIVLSWLLGLRNARGYRITLATVGMVLVLLTMFGPGALDMMNVVSMAESFGTEIQESFGRAEAYAEADTTSFYRFTALASTGFGGLLRALLTLLGFVLIVPFPGWLLLHLETLIMWLWLPEMLVWHGILPFLFVGTYSALRGEVQVPHILLVTAGFMLVTLAFGTLGSTSAVHYRLMVMPILLLLVAVGLESLRRCVERHYVARVKLLAGVYYLGFALANVLYVAYRWS